MLKCRSNQDAGTFLNISVKSFLQFIESTLQEIPRKYYHGSDTLLSVGTTLKPTPDYEQNWSHSKFYRVLEHYRPATMLAHKDSVFMVGDVDDIELSGGRTDHIFVVQPLGKVERHDSNWSTEISLAIQDGIVPDDPEVAIMADNYWSGKPYHEAVWEYLTPSAKILSVKT